MKKVKCKVCRTRFIPGKRAMYLASEKVGPLPALTTAARTYECFDCPRCGCQIAVNVRMTPLALLKEKEGAADG